MVVRRAAVGDHDPRRNPLPLRAQRRRAVPAPGVGREDEPAGQLPPQDVSPIQSISPVISLTPGDEVSVRNRLGNVSDNVFLFDVFLLQIFHHAALLACGPGGKAHIHESSPGTGGHPDQFVHIQREFILKIQTPPKI